MIKKIIFSMSLLAVSSFGEELDAELMMQDGKRIYNETCVSCHGVNGETNPDMKLVVKPRKLNKTILNMEQSYQIIKNGAHHFGAHSDIMPGFQYVYDDELLKSVAYFISEKFNPNGQDRIDSLIKESKKISSKDELLMFKKGKKIFRRNCSLCHGIKGDGVSDYVTQSKASKIFIYPYNLKKTLLNEEQIFLYAKEGGVFWGTDKNHMPSWKKKYNDFDLKSVAKYIEDAIKN